MAKLIGKLAAVMVLLVFMLSIVPAALAGQDNGNLAQAGVNEAGDAGETAGSDSEDVDEEENNAEETGENTEATDNADSTEETADDRNVKIKNVVEKRLENNERLIVQARERMEQAREKFEDAKEKYVQARERFIENKQSLVMLTEKIRACKDDAEKCPKLKQELRKGIRQHLLKTSDLIERSLDRLVSKVESSIMSNEEKGQTLALITELEAELTAKKEAVEALKEEAVTNDELKVAIKELKKTWIKIRKEQRAILAGLMNSRLENVVEDKLSEMSAALGEKISEVQELGADTAELERLQAEFLAKVEETQQYQAEAQEKYQQFRNGEADIETWKQAQEQVRQALKESKEILREFLKEYKEIKKSLNENSDDDDANDAEEPVESDDNEE